MDDPSAASGPNRALDPPLTDAIQAGLEEQAATVQAATATQLPPAPAARIPGKPAGALFVDSTWWLPAGFWPRAAAFVLDGLILTLVTDIVVLASGVPMPDIQQLGALGDKLLQELSRGGTVSSQASPLLAQLRATSSYTAWISFLVCGAYFTIMHGLAGTTLGKAALGLRIMRTDSQPLHVGWAALRYIAYFLCAKLVYTAWLIPFDKERRTLYDIVLKTNVFRKSPV